MFYDFVKILLRFFFEISILFFISLAILIFMLFLYERNKNFYIKKCLLNFSLLEKEILIAILKYRDKSFPLTANSPITKKFLKLNILFESEEVSENPLHCIYCLNSEIFHLIKKDSDLSKIYF